MKNSDKSIEQKISELIIALLEIDEQSKYKVIYKSDIVDYIYDVKHIDGVN